MTDYPAEFNQTFEEALKLRDEDRLSESGDLLRILVEKFPDVGAAHAILGDVNWRLGDGASAITCFRNAVRCAPASELASLGLFHTLWDEGQQYEALEEMKRFLQGNQSEEYRTILKGITESLQKE